VSGEIDISNSPALEAAIAVAFRAHRGVTLVSLGECTFVDCSCLSVLIRQHRLYPARLMIVAPAASRLRRLLDLTSLTALLPVYDGLRAAQLAVAPEARASRDSVKGWKWSEQEHARLDEMTLMLRASPRFQLAFPARVSHLQLVRS
jgi:anti-anti-sigma factor